MLDEVIFCFVRIDYIASRGLDVEGVEVCRKLEGLIFEGDKILVELRRKSYPIYMDH